MSSNYPSVSILVVDDEPSLRFLLKKVLSTQTCRIYEAEDGMTALEQFQRVQPDIILLDIAMPGMNGVELLQEIRKRDQTVGILMVSAFKMPQIDVNVSELGVDAYLQKPFRLQKIQEEIQRVQMLTAARRDRILVT